MSGVWIYYCDYRIILEWVFIRVGSLNLEMFILVDWVSLLFIGFILIISSIIFVYRIGYIDRDLLIYRFLILILLFILSILIIILRPNILRILFGWDGLGLVSYCLVIYYQNYSSFNSGIVTVLTNRVGDVGLLMSIGLMCVYGRWNIWILTENKWIFILIILAAVTKRAQLPFSSWLPIAIAAPTPVSALVHSSTLVTAGVYLLIRFREALNKRQIRGYILLIISVLTIFIAGFIANFENDLKKIIALSTLSQLALIILCLSIELKMIAYYHLLIHALFKSLLFMCAGVIIHLLGNNQDIRMCGSLNRIIPYTIMRFYIANLALCGFPFLSGFYSKDLIIEIIYIKELNVMLLFIIILSLIFTVRYSFRLFYYLFFGELKFKSCMNIEEGGFMGIAIIILIVLRVIRGACINWLFFYDIYIPQLRFGEKFITIILCLRALLFIIIFINFKIVGIYYFYLGKIIILEYFLRKMWFLRSLIGWGYKMIGPVRIEVLKIDKTWVEVSRRMIFINYVINYRKFKLNIYKLFILINLVIVIILLYFLII